MAKQKLSPKTRAVDPAHMQLRKTLHRRRASWFAVLTIGLLVIQFSYNIHGDSQPQVLGYATHMSSNVLLDNTNGQRKEAGLPSLKPNATLSQAAQAKAESMAAQNYWSHVAPDGTTPWSYIQKVGYEYSTAGENLAYGFSTSDQVVTAWMNSPEHRDNILGNYQDIGFGVADSANYQGGKNTVIVAFYSLPSSQKAAVAGATTTAPHVAGYMPTTAQYVNGATSILSGNAPWATYASLMLIGATILGFLVTHLETLKLGWRNTRRYAVLHPVTDAVVLLCLALVVVQAAGGFIR